MKDMFKLWKNKKFPKELQHKIDGFANALIHSSPEIEIFRAGFYIGMRIKEIRKELGIEED